MSNIKGQSYTVHGYFTLLKPPPTSGRISLRRTENANNPH